MCWILKWRGLSLLGMALGLLLTAGAARAEERDAKTLRVLLPRSLFRDTPPALVKVMSRPLQSLIGSQTGHQAELQVGGDPEEQSTALKEGKAQFAVFHGHEFAWARQSNPELEPLVVCVIRQPEAHACLVVRKDSKAKGVACLKSKKLAVSQPARAHVYLFLERRCTTEGAEPRQYFSALRRPSGAEETLDRLVDEEVEAAVVDQGDFEDYQQSNPERGARLRVLTSSGKLPAAVIAYQRGALSDQEVARCRAGLIAADRTARGQELLKLCRITSFREVPADYSRQVEQVLKVYPPERPR